MKEKTRYISVAYKYDYQARDPILVRCSADCPKWIRKIGLYTNRNPSRYDLYNCTEPRTGMKLNDIGYPTRQKASRNAIHRLKNAGYKTYLKSLKKWLSQLENL